jgi:hypothetical protein
MKAVIVQKPRSLGFLTSAAAVQTQAIGEQAKGRRTGLPALSISINNGSQPTEIGAPLEDVVCIQHAQHQLART